MQGIGGPRYYAVETAAIVFTAADGRLVLSDHLKISVGLISSPQDLTTPLPSLLGMDIMGQGAFRASSSGVLLTLPGEYLPLTP